MPKRLVAKQEYYFDASPKKVFRYLSEPDRLVRWFLSEADLSPRKGGRFAFDWQGGYHMDGKLLAFSRNRGITFLWTDKLPSGETARTKAAFKVVAKNGGTVLQLRHSGFKHAGHYAECASRWAYYLTNMKSVVDHKQDLRSPMDW